MNHCLSLSRMRVPALLAGLLLFCTAVVNAETKFPERPIQIVVPFPAGGTTDIIGRSIGQRLGELWGQPVVLENRGGAGGNIGTEFVVRSAPDGYTWSINTAAPMVINPHLYNDLKFDPLRDLMPIARVADVPNALVVNSDVPANNLEEFVAYAKSRSEPLFYGSTGVGTAAHLTSFILSQRMGLEAIHVPYKGAAALNDLIGGRVQFMFATIPSVIGHVRAGKLKAIAISTTTRSSALPDVPTVAEQGVADFNMGTWYGFFVPKGTPREIIDKANKDINGILSNPAVIESLLHAGAEPVSTNSPEEFRRFIEDHSQSWKKIVVSSGATAN